MANEFFPLLSAVISIELHGILYVKRKSAQLR